LNKPGAGSEVASVAELVKSVLSRGIERYIEAALQAENSSIRKNDSTSKCL
jgi:hypothetical protein